MTLSRHTLVVAALAMAALPWLPRQSAADTWLVATRTLEAGPAEISLPEKLGVLLAGDRTDLAFEVAGRLVSHLEPETSVRVGEVVASLDTTLEEAQLLQAVLRLREAESERRRLRGLRDARATSAQRLESGETAVALRRAELVVAQEQVARRRIKSVMNGEVVETHLDPGEIAMPGTPIATVMKLDQLKVELAIPGFQIGRVRKGARVVLTVPALEGIVIDGEVSRVARANVDGGHLFTVEVVVENLSRRLLPGMSVGARIVTQTLEATLRIPLEAVLERDGRPVVFFVAEGIARAVPLELTTRVGNEVLLSAELPYRTLVIHGQRDLADGAAVRVDNSVLETAAAR